MAINFDISTGTAVSATNPLTWSHTCTGSDLILWVTVYRGVAGTISGVTYNGVSMTNVSSLAVVAQEVSLWYLIAPATGSNTVSVTGSGTAQIGGVSASYTGAKQSGQPDNSGTNTITLSSPNTINVTSVADNCWFVTAAFDNFAGLSAGTGATLRTDINAHLVGIFDSNAPKTPAGSYSMSINCDPSTTGCGVIMASFSPSPSSGVFTVPTLLLMNVG